MLLIVGCHIGHHYQNAILSQIFNVGVPLFFIISDGGLYAKKKSRIQKIGLSIEL